MTKHEYKAVHLSFAECRAFRSVLVENQELVEDEWDSDSDLVALISNSEIIATFRIVRPVDNRLPVSDHFPELPVSGSDRQIGRFVSSRKRWTIEAAQYFYQYYKQLLESITGLTYVATAEWGPISVKRYKSLGFKDTGRRYMDDRYPDELFIIVRDGSQVFGSKV